MALYVSKTPDLIVLQARAESAETGLNGRLAVIGDMWQEVRPGETMLGLTFEQWQSCGGAVEISDEPTPNGGPSQSRTIATMAAWRLSSSRRATRYTEPTESQSPNSARPAQAVRKKSPCQRAEIEGNRSPVKRPDKTEQQQAGSGRRTATICAGIRLRNGSVPAPRGISAGKRPGLEARPWHLARMSYAGAVYSRFIEVKTLREVHQMNGQRQDQSGVNRRDVLKQSVAAAAAVSFPRSAGAGTGPRGRGRRQRADHPGNHWNWAKMYL